jgi:hypothetical protein
MKRSELVLFTLSLVSLIGGTFIYHSLNVFTFAEYHYGKVVVGQSSCPKISAAPNVVCLFNGQNCQVQYSNGSSTPPTITLPPIVGDLPILIECGGDYIPPAGITSTVSSDSGNTEAAITTSLTPFQDCPAIFTLSSSCNPKEKTLYFENGDVAAIIEVCDPTGALTPYMVPANPNLKWRTGVPSC